MRRQEITNSDDIIDSRDVIKRIDELEGLDERDEDEQEELDKLKALQDEAEGYSPDWKYGATLIRESYFTKYAEQLAEDIGNYSSRDVKWPYTCIDWEKAADELKQDYTIVDFDGTDYYIR